MDTATVKAVPLIGILTLLIAPIPCLSEELHLCNGSSEYAQSCPAGSFGMARVSPLARREHRGTLPLLELIKANPDSFSKSPPDFLPTSVKLLDTCVDYAASIAECDKSLANWKTRFQNEINTARKLQGINTLRKSREAFQRSANPATNPFDAAIHFCEREDVNFAECEANSLPSGLKYIEYALQQNWLERDARDPK